MDRSFYGIGGLRSAAIEAILANAEASSDDELVQHFVSGLDLTQEQAQCVLSQRDSYSRHVFAVNAGTKKVDPADPRLYEGVEKWMGLSQSPSVTEPLYFGAEQGQGYGGRDKGIGCANEYRDH
jgi:hypothetical protein